MFFWYRLTRVFPDKFHRAVKRLLLFVVSLAPVNPDWFYFSDTGLLGSPSCVATVCCVTCLVLLNVQVDPDVIVGHDVVYDMDVLLHRIAACRISQWSKVGRLKRATMPKFAARSGAAVGRLILDTMVSAKELIRCRSYDLTEVTVTIGVLISGIVQ